jgi:membrane-associated PAP2 superfamily phosphatase
MKPKYIENFQTMALLPMLFLILAVIFEYSGLDFWWESLFYDFQNHLWPYKHYWLFDDCIHAGGQWFDKAMGLVWLITFILTYFRKKLRQSRKILLYFLFATALGPILVSAGKRFSHIYTPWDLQIFQGDQPYIKLFDPVPAGAPVGHGFPAGHSSGGYAFLSLYFVLFYFRSSYRFFGLLFGICIGLVFGLGQQIRGAHFPSHDLVTLAICWYASMVSYFLFFPNEQLSFLPRQGVQT